jgi:glycosyltransferase involved in cell wall biosynthesis
MSIYLSVVVPLYNEEESVAKLIERLTEVLDGFDFASEILLVDDGSQDRTWAIIEEFKQTTPMLRALKFKSNYGQTSAMVAGFDYARGEIIVTMDGDLQNDPGDIPLLLEKIDQGYDIVSGWRKDRQDHFSRVLPSNIANYLISKTTGVHLHDYGCSLKAYRAECIRSINAYGEMHRFFPALASMTGARVTEIPVHHSPRIHGVSKYGFERIFKVFSDIFAMNLIVKFSSMPLKGFAISSLPFLFLAAFFGLLAVSAWIFEWTTGKAVFFAFTGTLTAMAVVQLIALGILGELVVRTSDLSHTQLSEITQKKITAENNAESKIVKVQ